tara:strand:- start:4217 stop:4480 length:264 start_codon:yes stop_codon:yes gene_type:complete
MDDDTRSKLLSEVYAANKAKAEMSIFRPMLEGQIVEARDRLEAALPDGVLFNQAKCEVIRKLMRDMQAMIDSGAMAEVQLGGLYDET